MFDLRFAGFARRLVHMDASRGRLDLSRTRHSGVDREPHFPVENHVGKSVFRQFICQKRGVVRLSSTPVGLKTLRQFRVDRHQT